MRYLFTGGFLALWSSAVSQNLYVSSYNSGLVQAFNGATGAPLGTFATLPAGDTAGGLVFSPWDASLNVASFTGGRGDKFNGQTGAALGTFATLGGADHLVFCPALNLLVSSTVNNVVKFNGITGTSLGTFATVPDAEEAAFSNYDGSLIVVSRGNNEVLKFDWNTGAPLGVFASVNGLNGPY